MNNQEIYAAFDEKISKTCITDGKVIGKWCVIEKIGDEWDVFICNPKDMAKGLGTRKVNNILWGLQKMPVGTPVNRLNGETWLRTKDKDVILQNLDLLGIRKKRQLSEEARQKLSEQLKKARKLGK